VVIDKETGKAKEVDIYERGESKKKDPSKIKAIFSSSLEQSIIPDTISKPTCDVIRIIKHAYRA
jgi:hypothetical protein